MARESARRGLPLRWDEREAHHIDAAVRAADHVAKLQRLLNAELRGEKRASIAAKMMAEIRLQDQVVADHLARIQIGDLPVAKSPQHRDAAQQRWGENRPPKRRGA
ncbi:hypothetical protein H7K38_26655 [Mycobacterium alsense]|uniref:Uncharacterized protein n=1 Tax=Mycobacterium alsense TaxID=324058 RepID=A0AA41XYG1_9MYCO|nr:hypothetical protein [Mycobacterium alsense]